MADFNLAVTKTLASEGGFFSNPVTGEVVNMGITVAFLRAVGKLPPRTGPASEGETAFVRSLTVDAAKQLYLQYFWHPVQGDAIQSQSLAEKVFDLAVNCGIGTSVMFAQRAVNVVTFPDLPLVVDGAIGPKSIARINACNPIALLASIRAQAETHYRNIAANNPKLAEDLPAWLGRLAS